MVFKVLICAAQERARKRETYQFHGRGCGRRCSGLGGGGWVSRKRLEGGVTTEMEARERGRGARENEWWSRGRQRLEARNRG
ncbi:hypothetical protein TIFTF001_040443 [Ficus carica]|uniref:Uncharacterized protein n=1 Tax=Ficus carica TaxID=3494 RepID=A0AA87YTQ7_FICCA|nr:hypothetical protein TIFTF001_040442 [Ficus carica]GMN23356.1 hypothetical protein TIFTF001_040443 [Ficus carica]